MAMTEEFIQLRDQFFELQAWGAKLWQMVQANIKAIAPDLAPDLLSIDLSVQNNLVNFFKGGASDEEKIARISELLEGEIIYRAFNEQMLELFTRQDGIIKTMMGDPGLDKEPRRKFEAREIELYHILKGQSPHQGSPVQQSSSATGSSSSPASGLPDVGEGGGRIAARATPRRSIVAYGQTTRAARFLAAQM